MNLTNDICLKPSFCKNYEQALNFLTKDSENNKNLQNKVVKLLKINHKIDVNMQDFISHISKKANIFTASSDNNMSNKAHKDRQKFDCDKCFDFLYKKFFDFFQTNINGLHPLETDILTIKTSTSSSSIKDENFGKEHSVFINGYIIKLNEIRSKTNSISTLFYKDEISDIELERVLSNKESLQRIVTELKTIFSLLDEIYDLEEFVKNKKHLAYFSDSCLNKTIQNDELESIADDILRNVCNIFHFFGRVFEQVYTKILNYCVDNAEKLKKTVNQTRTEVVSYLHKNLPILETGFYKAYSENTTHFFKRYELFVNTSGQINFFKMNLLELLHLGELYINLKEDEENVQ